MDIKGLVRSVIPFSTPAVKKSSRKDVKTESSTDREGNGQSAQEESRKRMLSPDEIKEAIAYLEGLPGVKDNNLRVRLEQTESSQCVYVEDAKGKVVRRIPLAELYLVLDNRSQKSGHLLNKAM